MDDIVRRPAARVVCFDPDARFLLMHWQDPVSGRRILEPPGGGVEPGERPIDAARRELLEEVGRALSLREDWSVDCERDCQWVGLRVLATERFYGATVSHAFEPNPRAVSSTEVASYLGAYWLSSTSLMRLSDLPGDLEPPNLAALVGVLVAMRRSR